MHTDIAESGGRDQYFSLMQTKQRRTAREGAARSVLRLALGLAWRGNAKALGFGWTMRISHEKALSHCGKHQDCDDYEASDSICARRISNKLNLFAPPAYNWSRI
jgi:hypothetical protein